MAIPAAVAWNSYAVRTPVRWLLWSGGYKSKVLANPSPTGEFKHIEWDGWGWAGQDTSVYLVYDPTDQLAKASGNPRPGRLKGLPCEAYMVNRLESRWYTVQFYTNEFWGKRNTLDCTGELLRDQHPANTYFRGSGFPIP